MFERIPYGEGRWVLLLRDCGVFSVDFDSQRNSLCEEWQKGFRVGGSYRARNGRTMAYRGDPEVLDGMLSQDPPMEVWFFSGGGHLQAGVDIGRVLRARRMAVRVPSAARLRAALQRNDPSREVACVSACTVAFMGGLFRYMDDGASYEVHSGSWVSGGIPGFIQAYLDKGDFMGLARWAQQEGRFTARQLLTHFQNTLLQVVNTPKRPENDTEFKRWAESATAPPRYSAQQAAADRERLAAEGAAAAQDILMRMERDAIAWAADDLRAMLPQLGPRAAAALRMVEAMYDVSIKETASLTRETMLRMGYLTHEIDLEAKN